MKKVDVWETVAAVAMHVERERMAGNVPQSELGAYSVAETLGHMNSLATTLHRIATERANGFRSEAARTTADKKEKSAGQSLAAHAKRLRLNAEIGDMGYVELTAGAYRLGCLPLKG